MKKLFLLILPLLFLASCDGTMSYPEDLTTKQIVNLKVNSTNWILKTDGVTKYYSAYVKVDALTDRVYTNGGVVAYIDYNDYQQVLPMVRHYGDTKGNLWTKTIDYEVEKGGITFYVTNSDFVTDAPETMYFKVILFW